MNIYLLLTILGGLAKIWALTVLRRNWHDTALHGCILSFIIILLLQTACELPNYLLAQQPTSPGAYWIVVSYYVCSFVMITHLPFIACFISDKTILPTMVVTAIILNIIIISTLVFSNLIISDVQTLGYALTRVPGDYYWVFQVSSMIVLLFTFVTLIQGVKNEDLFIKARSSNLLIGFIPVATVASLIVFAMHLGYPINAIGVLPICFVIYVAVIVSNANPIRVPDYTRFIPFTNKWRLLKKIQAPFVVVERNGMQPEKEEYNQLLAKYALHMFEGDYTKAAQYLNVSNSWIYRRFPKKYKNF